MPISGYQIREFIKKGDLSVNPILDKNEQIESAKVDLRLDNVFYRVKSEQSIYRDTLLDPVDYDHTEKIVVPYADVTPDSDSNRGEKPSEITDGFVLHPDEFALVETFEYVDLPMWLRGGLSGRSSMGREGVVVHSTASVIDPGYAGTITLELSTNGNLPLVLYPRQRIASIEFEHVDGDEDKIPESDSQFGGAGSPEPDRDDIEDEHIMGESI